MWNSPPLPPHPPMIVERDWVEILNLFAVLLHGGQAIAVAAIYERLGESTMFNGGRLPLFRTSWNATTHSDNNDKNTSSSLGDTEAYVLVQYGHLDIRACILVFFIFSALFQGAASWLSAGRSGIWRYVEYSMSASTMVLGIVADWTSLLIGGTWAWVVPHLASWATCLTAYGCILDSFGFNASRGSPPDFVRIIVYLQFGLFTCFGLVQTWALARRTYAMSSGLGGGGGGGSAEEQALMIARRNDARRMMKSRGEFDVDDDSDDKDEDGVEVVFIVLSLTAKTLLSWIVLSPLLSEGRRD